MLHPKQSCRTHLQPLIIRGLPLFLTLHAPYANAQPNRVIKIAAYELHPYLVKDRSEHGYLFEIVKSVFSNLNYEVDVKFYPPARAKKMVRNGEHDVLIPAYALAEDAKDLIYAQPIHGGDITFIQLMKPTEAPPHNGVRSLTHRLANVTSSSLDFGTRLKAENSNSENIVQLLDMLAHGRVQRAVVDKLQAADAMVNSRPNLIGKIQFLTPNLGSKDFQIAFSRKLPNHEKILEEFNRGLFQLQQSGEYDRILSRYGYQKTIVNDRHLNIGIVPNPDMNILRELSQEYSSTHPNTKLNWVEMDENILRRRILSGIVLNETFFDVIAIGNYDTRIYAEKGWIGPIKPHKSYNSDDILGPVRNSLSYRGELYALPFYGETSVTYYRTDLFAKAGLKMPEKPRYPEIVDFAARLHDPKRGIYGICLRGKPGWGENMAFITTLVHSFGGKWFNKNWQPQLISSEWRNAVKFYIDALTNYGHPQAYELGYQENLKLFAEGHCGIWVDASVASSFLMNPLKSQVSSQTAVTHAPIMQPGEGNHWLWTWALAIPNSSTKKAEALEFATWATSQEYIELVAKKKGWLAIPPGTRHSTYAHAIYQKLAPFSSLIKQEIEKTFTGDVLAAPYLPEAEIQFVRIPEFTALGTSVGIAISQLLQKKSSIEKVLSESQFEAENIMWHAGYIPARTQTLEMGQQ